MGCLPERRQSLAKDHLLTYIALRTLCAGDVERLLHALAGEMSRQQIQDACMLKHADHFRTPYRTPALATNLLEMTQPDKPRSSKQRYHLTATGRRWIEQSSIAEKIKPPTSNNEIP